MDSDWARQRDRALTAHAAEAARRRAADADRAAEMLHGFVADARTRGIAPTALLAHSYDGRHRYRTGLHGWYVGVGDRCAVDEAGRWFILSVPGSLRARLAGVDLIPTRPRLVIGEGGSDGESIPLRQLLDRRLAA